MEKQSKQITQITQNSQDTLEFKNYSDLIQFIIKNEGNTNLNIIDFLRIRFNDILIKDLNDNSNLVNEKESSINIFYDIQENMANFCLKFFNEVDNSRYIYENILGKKNNYHTFNSIFDLMLSYKIQENNIFIVNDKVKQSALGLYSKINIKFLPRFVQIFDLKNELFNNEDGFIVNFINKMIDNLDDPNKEQVKTDFIIKHLEFIYRLLSNDDLNMFDMLEIEEMTNSTISDKMSSTSGTENSTSAKSIEPMVSNSIINNDILNKINYKKVLNKLIQDKNLFSQVKRLLKVYPNESEGIVKYCLVNNDTKQACLIVSDKKLSQFITNDLYERTVYESQCKSVRYNYSRYLDKDLNIVQLVDLYEAYPKLASYLANLFLKHKLFKEAYFIIKYFNFDIEEKIKIDEENKKEFLDFLQQNTTEKIEQLDATLLESFSTNPEINITIPEKFGPKDETCLNLPIPQENVLFISTEEDLDKLEYLRNSPEIGFDLEWKTKNSALDIDNEVALMQIASRNYVVLVDMIKFAKNENFMKMFEKVLPTNKTKLIGFQIKNDLKVLKEPLKSIVRLYEIIELSTYAELYGNMVKKKGFVFGLNDLCLHLLGKKIDKSEQLTNWEKRPLRLQQIHYAALDAHVMLTIFDKINK